jgi:hypothetical protein
MHAKAFMAAGRPLRGGPIDGIAIEWRYGGNSVIAETPLAAAAQ